MAIIIVDTCLAACQVALAEGGRVIAGASEPMERGHQERLASMTAEVMARAGFSFAGLDKIAVTIGPGSFTGLRVGLAFAKGLSLATGAPLAGIGTLEALAASAPGGPAGAVIDARRGQVYVQAFEANGPRSAPQALSLADAAALLSEGQGDELTVIGPGAGLLREVLPAARVIDLAAPTLEALARLAERTASSVDVRPVYLRAPDARPMPA
jgi:tRNA threonylcarbamoyladenosine biosynthesis protein TsaB